MLSIPTVMKTGFKVWDPGIILYYKKMYYSSCRNQCRMKSWPYLLDSFLYKKQMFCSSFSNLIIKYNSIWRKFNKTSILLSTMREELKRCEQDFLEHSFCLSYMNCEPFHCTEIPEITTLLHVFHVFSVSGQETKKSFVMQALRTQLAKKSGTDLYHIYNKYIDQLMARKLMVTEEDLCIREIDPYYEFLLKLCYDEKLIKKEKYEQYNEFMVKNLDFVMSIIKEMKTRKDYGTMSEFCILLLHFVHVSWDKPCGFRNQELTCLLSDLLSMLPQGLLYYTTLEVYFEQVEMMNFSVRFEDLCSSIGRINPHLKLKLILSYCEHLIKHKHYQLYRTFMVQNLKLLIDLKIKAGGNESSFRTVSHYYERLCDPMNNQWNNEKYRIIKLTSLLSRLLSMLPEDELYETVSHYLFLVKNMKSDIVLKYLYSVKTDPYLKLTFKLFWWSKLIKEGHAGIVNRCLNNFYREKCQENKAECIALIISITDNLSEQKFLQEFLQCFLRKNLKTVSSMATTEHGNERCKYNKELKYEQNMSKQDLIYTQCASILSGKKMKNIDIKQYSRKFNMKGPEGENEIEMQSQQVKLLILFILLLVTTLGHKSAKLKKYLALKYEYDMASFYLLWCSGDIEVHPGPPWRKKQLEHNSEQKRKWLQDINSILLKLYWVIPTHSKPKNLWQKDNRPKQWPSDKPFYDTKNASKDAKGNKITDDEILTCLLECLKKKNVVIPQIYQSEISAWTNVYTQLLHKLQVFRIEMENVKSASLNLLLSNLEDAKNLQNINVSLENPTLGKMQTEGLVNNDLRQKKQAEIVAEITRDLANTLCRLAKKTDPMEKGDGTWNIPPVDWPEDVPFFNPNNRGKNKDKPKCPDKVLVCTFLKLRYMKIPQNIKQIVDAYQTVYNSTNTEEKKKKKDELCRLYTIQSNLERLDCSLQYLHKEGLFSREVHAILNQWWKTQSVDENAEHVLKNAIVRSDERPHITIDITKGFEPDASLRYISYTIPIKDAYLHIKCTTVHPNQLNHKQTITGSLITANYPENIEDSVIPPDVTDFVLEHDSVDQTKCPYDNSVMNTDNGPMTFDLQRQENPLPVTHQHLKPYDDLDTLTTHNTLSSDLNGSRCTTEYDTTSLQASDSVYSSNVSTGDNFGCNMGTSKIKRKQLEDKEEPVKKLLKIEVNQCGHYDQIDEDSSSAESKSNGLSLEPNPDSTGNLVKICSDNVLDSWSLDFSLADRNSANNLGAMCECKNSEDIQSCKQMCHLENLVHQNQQYLPENIDEVKNNDNQNDPIEDDKELESFSDLDNFISGKPSQMAKDLLQ